MVKLKLIESKKSRYENEDSEQNELHSSTNSIDPELLISLFADFQKSMEDTIGKLYSSAKNIQLKEINNDLSFSEAYPIVIETCKDDEVTATLQDLNLYGAGDNEYEAVEMLKSEISSLYYDLKDEPETKLGKNPKKWKSFMKRNITEQ